MLLSRFKACLVGAVTADCIGALFEGMNHVRLADVLEATTSLEKNRKLQKEKGVRPADMYALSFTDDTAMARSVAASLLEKQQFDAQDMAHRFAEEYAKEPNRGYGGNIVTVFKSLKKTDLDDVFKPASEQFDGSGSYGNGGAMRIAPAALFAFYENDLSKLESLVSSITRLTHTNHQGVNGAILEALAVDQSLRLPDLSALDADEFIDNLISKMKPTEEESSARLEPPPAKKVLQKRKLDAGPTPYCAKLKKIKEFLKQEELTVKEVVDELGTDVSALGSVPAAVLCFLKVATRPSMPDKTKFEETVIYAISLGGDTDTVATMAAAMAGALYGMDQIPEPWQYYCEGVADAETMAEQMFERGRDTGGSGAAQSDS